MGGARAAAGEVRPAARPGLGPSDGSEYRSVLGGQLPSLQTSNLGVLQSETS